MSLYFFLRCCCFQFKDLNSRAPRATACSFHRPPSVCQSQRQPMNVYSRSTDTVALVTLWCWSPFTLPPCLLSTGSKLISKKVRLRFSIDFKTVYYHWPHCHFIFYSPSLPVSFQTHIWARIELALPAPFHPLAPGSPVDRVPVGCLSWMLVAGIQQLPAVHSFFLSASLSPGFLPASTASLLFCRLDIQGHYLPTGPEQVQRALF